MCFGGEIESQVDEAILNPLDQKGVNEKRMSQAGEQVQKSGRSFVIALLRSVLLRPSDSGAYRQPEISALFVVHRINQLLPPKEAKPGTLGTLIKRYRASPRFQKRVPCTGAEYQMVFNWPKP